MPNADRRQQDAAQKLIQLLPSVNQLVRDGDGEHSAEDPGRKHQAGRDQRGLSGAATNAAVADATIASCTGTVKQRQHPVVDAPSGRSRGLGRELERRAAATPLDDWHDDVGDDERQTASSALG